MGGFVNHGKEEPSSAQQSQADSGPNRTTEGLGGESQTTQDMCDECKDVPSLWHCDACDLNYCEGCYDKRSLHQRGDRGHNRLAHTIHKSFRNVFNPLWTAEDYQKMHDEDSEAAWFGVSKSQKEELSFDILPRYARLISAYRVRHHEFMTCYPRLVSFVGPRGGGKSTLVRILIERPWLQAGENTRFSSLAGTPVVRKGNNTLPTSGDVNLYGCDDGIEGHPLFYADCEGLDGGEVAPSGAFFQRWRDNSVAALSGMWKFFKPARSLSLNNLWTTAESEAPSREVAVTKLLPRLLYNFSDVIVFVVGSRESGGMENVLRRVLDWAQISSASAVNRTSLPHLVVVLNGAENFEETAWDPKEATERVFAEHKDAVKTNAGILEIKKRYEHNSVEISDLESLLKKSYGSIQFLWIPNGFNGHNHSRLSDQLQKLLEITNARSRESQDLKIQCGLLLSSQDQELFFQHAFSHYSKHIDEPLNIIRELMSLNPMPDSLASRIFQFLLVVDAAQDEDLNDALHMFKTAAPVIASALALDATRFYRRVPGRTSDIFRGNLLPHGNATRDLYHNTYESYIRKAVEELCEKYLPCEYQDLFGRTCVNSRLSHKSINQHQDASGSLIGYGPFDSHSNDGLRGNWVEVLDDHIKNADTEISARIEAFAESSAPETTLQKARAVWSVHRENLTKLYSTRVKLDTRKLYRMCAWCLTRAPFKVTPCDHAICSACAKAECSFRDNADYQRFVHLYACPLHPQEMLFDPPFVMQLRPHFAGVRILSLDGGGVRGILEVKVLAAIEAILRGRGGKIQIQRFFDLIAGTSTGGLLAVGQGVKNWTTEECARHYESLCDKAFTKSPFWKIFSCKYNEEPFEKALKEVVGTGPMISAQVGPAERQFLSERGNLREKLEHGNEINAHSSEISITATKDGGARACIFANYIRDSSDKVLSFTDDDQRRRNLDPYDFEMNTSASNLTVWEVLRATTAAPSYFEGFSNGKTPEYWDGGLFNNNPAYIAHSEAKRLWPSVASRHPDILLSVGSGRNSKKAVHNQEKIHSGWGIFKAYRIAENRFKAALDSDAIWHTHFQDSGLEKRHPSRYVRLNGIYEDRLPSLDDVSALKSGLLNSLAEEFIEQENPKIIRTAHRLIATSFYFHPVQAPWVNEAGEVKFKGYIGCRLADRSTDLDEFHKTLCWYGDIQFELERPACKWRIVPQKQREMKQKRVWRLPIVEFSLPRDVKEFNILISTEVFQKEPISGCPWPVRIGDGDITQQLSALEIETS